MVITPLLPEFSGSLGANLPEGAEQGPPEGVKRAVHMSNISWLTPSTSDW